MSDIRFTAKAYIDAGWAVVPLVKGEKRASTSWRNKTYSVADFAADDGIALKCGEPSGWRVDVDLDCPEAIAAARELLPNTQLIHGRLSKPSSHWWFVCKDIKTTQFTDVKPDAKGAGPMLVEIRSTGGYTAGPPSVNPSGETLEWEIQREAMEIEPTALYEAVREVALVAILARHWQEYGHHAIGPLAGFLTLGGCPSAVRIITLAAKIAGASSDQQRDARNFAETTVSKVKAGEKVTGGPTLQEHLQDALVDKMRGWLRLADTDAIEEMNAKHFWVRMGKDDVIGREDDPRGVVFQRVKALYSEYANRKIVVGETAKGVPEWKPLFQAWLEAKNRRSYRNVVFCPPPHKSDDLDFNLWSGFAVLPDPAGDPTMFLEHLRDIICSGNVEHYEYLLNLLALTCQEPGTPSEVATVLRGAPGTGKGTFVRALGKIFGKHFIHLDNVKHLLGGFNAAISGKVIVFADEAFWAGDKKEIGALKRLITEPTLTIERKGIDAIQEANHVHLFMASNEEWVVPAQLQERRFFALHVSSARQGDHEYFTKLEDSLRDGGLAGFLHMMLTRPIDRKLIRRVPATEELRTQQGQSLSPVLEWWQDCLYEGKIGTLGWSATWMPVGAIYDAYTTAAKHGRVLSKIEFGRRMALYLSVSEAKSRKINGEVVRCIELRDLDEARKYFDAQLQSTTEWPDDAQNPPPPASPF